MSINLIGISGYNGVGKDTVGNIIRYLSYKNKVKSGEYDNVNCTLDDFLSGEGESPYKVKKFASLPNKINWEITGVNYLELSRKEKEEYRPKFIEFAEGMKKIYGGDVWVNALFKDYTKEFNRREFFGYGIGMVRYGGTYPNWIITDVRFDNEANVIKSKGGIIINVDNRTFGGNIPHWADYNVKNTSTIRSLVHTIDQLNLDIY